MSDETTEDTVEAAADNEAEGTTGAAQAAGSTATPKAAAPKAVAVEADEDARGNHRKVREGIVVSTAMDKTAVVAVTERVRHPRYAKTVQRTRKLYAHDEENTAANGDRVSVAETRPLSKTKRWRIVEVLERAR
jgi:small subunit ribosomal protein S17